MRICPKCGYYESPYWRHSRFSYWIDLITLENLWEIEPKLAQELERNGRAEDKYYVYRLAGKTKRYVERKCKLDGLGDLWREPREKPRERVTDFRKINRVEPNQKKLLGFIK